MPLLPTALPTVEQAWRHALYGPDGFYRSGWPREHFATATQRGQDVARILVRLARRTGSDTVVDMGAGAGELLTAVHSQAPDLRLVAVELRPRPAGLPAAVGWLSELPRHVDGLLVGHELLDTVPCPVVRADPSGEPRVLHVDPSTGREAPGGLVAGADADWLARWWPLGPGARAEVGRAREAGWAEAVARLGTGVAVAVDYGHVRRQRPPAGSLRAYAAGRRVPLGWDGGCDVTADVALDALTARVGGTLHRQRDLLRALPVVPLDDPPGDPPATPPGDPPGEWRKHGGTRRAEQRDSATRLRAMTRAGEAAEVSASGGLGELRWVLTPVGPVEPTARVVPAPRWPA